MVTLEILGDQRSLLDSPQISIKPQKAFQQSGQKHLEEHKFPPPPPISNWVKHAFMPFSNENLQCMRYL